MYFLENEKIGLRPLEEQDVEGNYSKWLNDKEVCKYNSHHRYPSSKDELKSYIQRTKGNSSLLVFAIEDKKEKKHIGNISLQNIDFINRCAEIAFLIGEKDYWKKGYAKTAAILLINHGFEQLGLLRIYFGTSSENMGMQGLGERLGFQKEGRRRKALYKNNQFWDIVEYGLLKEEWTIE